jgi:NAD(P)-dependent dehydrogenase (short-subunit alcohol dehydrogenase family)
VTSTEQRERAGSTSVGDATASSPEPSLDGRVVLVTGGSRGLGAAIARELAAAGAVVTVGDVRLDGARDVADALPGGAGRSIELDVSNEASVRAAVRTVEDERGGIDVVVNNAGIDETAALEDIPLERWDRIISVNLRGPMLMCREAFPVMRRRGGGHVVNIVSTAAKRAWANASAYHASKWGLLGLSHALHVEGREHGIRVSAVVAGGMRTPFIFDRFPETDPGVLQPPENVARAVRFVLLQPEDTVIPEIMVLPTHETSWP